MVQIEVKKKTRIYALAAVLLAIMLISVIYVFGSSPSLSPSNQKPGTQQPNPNGQVPINLAASGMKTFTSLKALENYINGTSQASSSFAGGPLDAQFFGAQAPTPTAVPSAASSLSGASQNTPATASAPYTGSFSTTNIQVAGVDEADTVKTDGNYIYTVSTSSNPSYYYGGYNPQTSNAVYIIYADPQNPQVVSKILLANDTEPAGLYLSQDGNKLVVIASRYQFYAIPLMGGAVALPASGEFAMPMIPAYQANVYTYINVYDISNKADPVLTRNFTVSGSYFDSRMIGNYVYAVVSQPATVYNNNVSLPQIYNGNMGYGIAPTSVYYADMVMPSYYTFTSFFGIDVSNDTQQPTDLTVMMGGASNMYVSQNNMYVTYPTWTTSGEYTSIYRVSINGAQLTFQAEGNVPGYTINQYSMDEYNGYFRIATNLYNTTQMNNIYVLDSNLTVVGKLEGVAQNESLYAVRFMGDRAYVVTFHNTDPFFVVDLSNPTAPKIAGQLKIPGYSSFLQPYDANHVIGIGSETTFSSGMENNNLKLSLFDVTDLNNPTEIANYVVEGNYTSSTALNDPKALLFDLQKQLLVLPVSIDNYYYNVTLGSGTGSSNGSGGSIASPPSAAPAPQPGVIISSNSEEYWQGACVFNLNLNSGFTLKGTVTHLNSTLLDSQGFVTDSTAYYNSQNDLITRSLYIGNTLYTVSNSEVKLTNLADMTQIGQVNLT